MQNTARTFLLLAVFFFASCHSPPPPTPSAASAASLAPSAHRLAGRVVAVDAVLRFAFVELAPTSPSLQPDVELLARTDDLRETAHLRTTRQFSGRTLGTFVISGQPLPGDEVVLAVP